MKFKKSRALSVIAFSALLGMGSISLVSCGEKSVEYSWNASEDDTNSKVELSQLSDSLIVREKDLSYFSPYIVELSDDGSWSFITSDHETLMESGDSASLLAYGVPSGYKLFASAKNKATGASVSGIVAADGSIKCPSVSVKTEYVITLSAVSEELLAKGKTEAKVAKDEVNLTVVPKGSIAKSTTVYKPSLSVKERSEITANLEQYAMEHGLTGIKYSSNAGQALYNSRISSPLLDANNYLPSYGFGNYQYGTISEGLATETTDALKMYYHSVLNPDSETGTINYLNSKLSSVNDQYSYISSSFWGHALNEDYSAYEDINILARAKPEPLNADENGIATKWKVKVWVGGDEDNEEKGVKKGLCYRTNSSDSTLSAFDKRNVKLEDYITPIKLMATGAIGWYRGNEIANSSSKKTVLEGYRAFYKATGEDKAIKSNEEFMKAVKVSIDETDNSITYELEEGFDQDFATYYLDTLYCNPMCEDFVAAVGKVANKDGGADDVINGAKVYGTSPTGFTPKDTALSFGPYYCEFYNPQVDIAYKRNEEWPLDVDNHGRDLYQIEGYYYKVDSALKQDTEESMKQFEAGYTDAVSLSTDAHYAKYKTDPRLRTTKASNYFGYTFSKMDKALWDNYFGEGGLWYNEVNSDGSFTVDKVVNPVLQNANYFKALNLGFDRTAYAEANHDTINYEYFAPVEKVSPAASDYYNNSDEHKAAIKNVYGTGFDDLSKSPDAAVSFMQDALIEELDAGHIDLGTADAPTNFGFSTVTLSSAYYTKQVNYANEYWGKVMDNAVESYVDDSGNNPLMDGSSHLVDFIVVQDQASGQNDLLYGYWSGKWDSQSVFTISGNTLDSIDYVEILTCNAVGGFELSFAVDTSIPAATLEMDGKYYSFESIWNACAGGGVTIDEKGHGTQGIAK